MMTAQYGKATVDRVIDIDPFALPLGFLFPDAQPGALAPHAEALDRHVDLAAGNILLAVQSHLVRFAGKTILIDTCVGEHKERPARAEWHLRRHTQYLSQLSACGCRPDDIDIVMCTHLHADHVGWNTRLEAGRWVPTFPKAHYLIGRTELDHWREQVATKPAANHASFEDSVLPVVEHGLAVPVEAGSDIVDGGRIVALPGHTPGQIGLELAAGQNEGIVFCGDAIHSPVQVFRPEWSSAFCTNRQTAEATRRALIERAAAENLRLIPAHLRTGSMRVREKAGGFVPAFSA
jgi:glyoxylase-like metal-dependent hydrolase (beta-lactamase superfamily II)